jgi:hypothetical protein
MSRAEQGAFFRDAQGKRKFVLQKNMREALEDDNLQIEPGQNLSFTDPATGRTVTTTGGEFERIQSESPGAALVGQDFVRAAEEERFLDEHYGGLPGGAAAIGTGLLRGGTLGLSDAAFDAIGVDRKDLQNLRAANPNLSLASEITGAVAPGLFSGGGGFVGAAARLTPAGRVSLAGSRVAKSVGGTKGLIAAGTLEGALYGGSQGLSNVLLNDEPLTAEAMFSEIGMNAIYGAGLGAGAGLLGAGLQKVGTKLQQGLIKKANPTMNLASKEGKEAVARLTRSAQQLDSLSAGLFAKSAAPAAKTLEGVSEAATALSGARQTLRSSLGQKADDTIDISNIFKQEPDQALKSVKAMDDYMVALDDMAAKVDPATRAKLVTAGNSISDDIAKVVNKGDEGLTGSDVVGMAAIFGIEEALIPDMAGPADELLKLYFAHKMVKGAGGKGKVGLTKFQKHSKQLVQGFAGRAVTDNIFSPVGRAKNAIARSIAGEAFDRGILGTNRLAAATGNAVNRVSEAMSKSLTTTGKAVRRSSPVTAQVLKDVSFSGQEERDKAEEDSAHAAFKARSQELSSAVANMPATVRRIHENLSMVRQANVGVGDKMAGHSKRVLQFLYGKMPKDPGILKQFGVSKWRPTEAQMDKWARYINAARDPAGIVERFANGHMSREDAETLRVLYPSHFTKVQEWVMDNLQDIQTGYTYERRIQISTLMGVAADPTITRVNVWQQSFAQQPQEDPRQQQPQQGKLNIQNREQLTMSQRLTGAR